MKARIFPIVNQIWLLPMMHCLFKHKHNRLPLDRNVPSSPISCRATHINGRLELLANKNQKPETVIESTAMLNPDVDGLFNYSFNCFAKNDLQNMKIMVSSNHQHCISKIRIPGSPGS